MKYVTTDSKLLRHAVKMTGIITDQGHEVSFNGSRTNLVIRSDDLTVEISGISEAVIAAVQPVVNGYWGGKGEPSVGHTVDYSGVVGTVDYIAPNKRIYVIVQGDGTTLVCWDVKQLKAIPQLTKKQHDAIEDVKHWQSKGAFSVATGDAMIELIKKDK